MPSGAFRSAKGCRRDENLSRRGCKLVRLRATMSPGFANKEDQVGRPFADRKATLRAEAPSRRVLVDDARSATLSIIHNVLSSAPSSAAPMKQ
jgi:hypothetical protein